MKRVMFYCQHVLGIGHLVRSAEIVRALARDFSVLFVTGGEIPEGFRFPENVATCELIPLKTTQDFSELQLCDLSWDLEETKAIRREVLRHAFDEFQPDVLITELFPFGRKQFSFELLPLLARAHSRPGKTMVACSIRDILVQRKNQEEYEQRVCELVNSFYDLVLVHGDARFQTLGETFSSVSGLQCPLAYTGYVVQQSALAAEHTAVSEPSGEQPKIVVSNGSGMCASGHHLLESVLRASTLLSKRIPHHFQVFAGPLMPEGVYGRLQEIAAVSQNVNLSRYTSNLPGLMRRADLSISMAGYNTVMDILSANVRALVYPITGNGDDEQSIRAHKLADMGMLSILGEGDLAPEKLAASIERALGSKPPIARINTNGAINSCLILKQYLSARGESLASNRNPSGPHALCGAAANI